MSQDIEKVLSILRSLGPYGTEDYDAACQAIDYIRALDAEIARLRAALKKYGMHLTECEANESYGAEPCSCGLKQLLADEQAQT